MKNFIVFATFIIVLTKPIRSALYLGEFEQTSHAVSGQVRTSGLDDDRVHISNFHYDGKGPATHFVIGLRGGSSSDVTVDDSGLVLADENGSLDKLHSYHGSNFSISLSGHKFKDVLWFAVWCKQFKVDFGHVFLTGEYTYDDVNLTY